MKILIAGDYAPRERLEPLVNNNRSDIIFKEIYHITNSVDYSIVNLECPVADETDNPIIKFGPNLKCTNHAIEAIKYAGFKCATLANNHIRDYGDNGVRKTIDTLNHYEIDYVGAGRDSISASAVHYYQCGNEKIAFINCCENEFSIATSNSYGANPMIPTKIFYSISEAKLKADYVVVIVHGGHEHYQLPSPRMQDTYRFFADVGADIIVNHHQHCYSGYEIYKGKPIVYGTGNFCMDKKPIQINKPWNYGYMVIWDTQQNDQIKIIPYEQCGESPTIHVLNANTFDRTLVQLNTIIKNRPLLETEINKYYQKSSNYIHNIFEPIQNRYISALQRRHILPSLITKRWLLKLENYTLCESHRDKVEFYLKSKTNSL